MPQWVFSLAMGRILLILLVVYIIYWVYVRLVSPFREMKKNFEEGMRSGPQGRADQRAEGEIRVEQPKESQPRPKTDDGEYVDFEEVE